MSKAHTQAAQRWNLFIFFIFFFKERAKRFALNQQTGPGPRARPSVRRSGDTVGDFLQKGSNVSFCYNYALCFIFHSPQNISLLSQGY